MPRGLVALDCVDRLSCALIQIDYDIARRKVKDLISKPGKDGSVLQAVCFRTSWTARQHAIQIADNLILTHIDNVFFAGRGQARRNKSGLRSHQRGVFPQRFRHHAFAVCALLILNTDARRK